MFAAIGICAKIDEKVGGVPKDMFGFIFVSFLIVQYFLFFWGGSHLAKAKGYSCAILGWGILCWLSQPILLAVLLFALPDKCPDPSDRRRKKKPRRDESKIARIVRYRRSALMASGFGVAGVLLALIFVFIPIGLFRSWDNAKVAGILVFFPSYAAIIYGCWWWVRAKNWPDAVVFIGLCPLAPLAIPYVRIFYVMTGVLPLLMVFMPLLLIGVVAALPDKSGMPKRKRWDLD
jgi:hypothetical protein